ncbi:Holliday junction branch migration protein RuvA [Candidatus Nomurabacteria bacterium]|nr:Holliday junction branch migration protein RuvA [Candidatus Kaiserbacteria bacterium]MCB9814490.1 Holliday junction branch migration protein RuvA [Candidatus Nomurabacteria bacterium]
MIRTLNGTISDLGEGWIIMEVNDIGYLVHCPTATTTFTLGEKLTLHTYLAVRETALDLYGFTSKSELEVFELLLNVPKIGPKSALQITNQASPTLLVEAISKNDGAYLHKLSGIGKKTCDNIVQFLQNKIEHLPEVAGGTNQSMTDVQTDAMDALISLGYDANTARETISKLSADNSTVNSLVTQALKQIK